MSEQYSAILLDTQYRSGFFTTDSIIGTPRSLRVPVLRKDWKVAWEAGPPDDCGYHELSFTLIAIDHIRHVAVYVRDAEPSNAPVRP